MKLKIAKIEADIVREEKEVGYWIDYRDRGASEHVKQIKLLEQELEDMQISHDEMASKLDSTIFLLHISLKKATGKYIIR